MARSPIIVPGLFSLGLYLFVSLRLETSNSAREVLTFIAIFAGLFVLSGFAFWRSEVFRLPKASQILVFAALFRIVMLFAGLPPGQTTSALRADLAGTRVGYDTFLLYDNDIWRYLWDGHVLGSGSSPYEFTPRQVADMAEDLLPTPPLESELWWDVLDNISYQSFTTVYPPLSQYLFALSDLLAPGSAFMMKLFLAMADFGTCLLLLAWIKRLDQPIHQLLLYAWNPLVIKEFSGSGHIDSLMVFLVVASMFLLAQRRELTGQVALAAATLSKIGAAALAPIALRQARPKTWWVLPGSLVLISAPLLLDLTHLLDGLAVYSRHWNFNSGPWAAIRELMEALGVANPDLGAHLITKGIIIVVIGFATWKSVGSDIDLVAATFAVLATLVLLNPAVMPWYLIWALPFAVLLGNRSWYLLTALSLLSYLIYFTKVERLWWLWVEYGVFFAAVVLEWRSRLRARRPA